MRIVVAGEALVDLVPDPDGRLRTLAGGSPFNVAIGLGGSASRSDCSARSPRTRSGICSRSRLSEAGVELLLPERTSRPTSLAMVHLDAAGHASYGFYLDGTSATGMTDDDVAGAAGEGRGGRERGAARLARRGHADAEGTGQVLGGMLATGPARPLVSSTPTSARRRSPTWTRSVPRSRRWSPRSMW
jgi:fructokinase